MAIPRPKILSRITVPTGGWTFKFYLSNAGAYDVPISVTVAAGDYFISQDHQSDDLLHEISDKATAGIEASALAAANAHLAIAIDETTHKIKIKIDGTHTAGGGSTDNVKLAWTECTAGLVSALGFDATADDTSTGTSYPVFTADYHHSHGWYADEDGLLEDLRVVDFSVVDSLQSNSLTGKVKTQKLAERFRNEMKLQFLTQPKTFSKDIGYGTAPEHPYARNVPLECWWQEAQQGIEFRVYRDGYRLQARAGENGAHTAADSTTVTDSGKSWAIEPFKWKDRIIYTNNWGTIYGTNPIPQAFFIASHTATVLTVANTAYSDVAVDVVPSADDDYWLFDHTYGTYVLNIEEMNTFEPVEKPAIDRYDIRIPLLKFVA